MGSHQHCLYRDRWLFWAQDRLGWPVSWVQADRKHVRATVIVRTSATRAPVGTNIAITGRIQPAGASGGVVLQRSYGGARRSVSSTSAQPAGGYRLLATPPRGYWHYRVCVLSGFDVFGTVSAAVTLRGV